MALSHDDLASIQRVIMTYAVEGDRGRIEAVAANFTDDGVLRMAGWRRQGRIDIVKQMRGEFDKTSMARPEFSRHHLTTSLIESHGVGVASGRTYFSVVTDIGLDHAGVYVDRFSKVDDVWLIADREVRIDWIQEGSTYGERLLPKIWRRGERGC